MLIFKALVVQALYNLSDEQTEYRLCHRLWLAGAALQRDRRGARNHSLSAREQQGNATRSRVRARVEQAFGQQATAMGDKLVRTIGLVRAEMKIGMQNLTYNMSRLVHLQGARASPA